MFRYVCRVRTDVLTSCALVELVKWIVRTVDMRVLSWSFAVVGVVVLCPIAVYFEITHGLLLNQRMQYDPRIVTPFWYDQTAFTKVHQVTGRCSVPVSKVASLGGVVQDVFAFLMWWGSIARGRDPLEIIMMCGASMATWFIWLPDETSTSVTPRPSFNDTADQESGAGVPLSPHREPSTVRVHVEGASVSVRRHVYLPSPANVASQDVAALRQHPAAVRAARVFGDDEDDEEFDFEASRLSLYHSLGPNPPP